MSVARDFVFIHINKTAGSSIEQALGLRFEHKTALEKRQELDPARWDASFTFTVVRNPWDKVVSQYHYRVRKNQSNLGNNLIGFKDWVRLAYGVNDPRYYNEPWKMFSPQWDWITDEQGNVLVNFVGRFENLTRDYEQICQHLKRNGPLPHLKRSQRGAYREYYDSATAEIIARWFYKDIVRFGYDF